MAASTEVLIANLGVMGVVLLGLGFFGRWWLQHLDKQEEERKVERGKERVEREKMVTGFLETCNVFNQTMTTVNATVSNHLEHQQAEFISMRDESAEYKEVLLAQSKVLCELTEQVREVCASVNGLCRMWGNGH